MARYIYEGIARDGAGNIVASATVTVYLAGTTTAATIYSAYSGGTADADSAVATGTDGKFTFYVDETDYATSQEFKVVIAKSGYASITYDYIKIFGINANLGAIGALTSAADKVPYFTGSGTADVMTVTADARTLLDNTVAQGDIIYGSAANTLAQLAKGTARQILAMNSGATVPEWVASATSTLTTAGDILYASSAYTLARLAKGAANTKLFMNSGATAPEWGSSFEVVAGTRDTALDTDWDISGAGFTPTATILMISTSGGEKGSIGFCDANGESGGLVFYPDTTLKVYNSTSPFGAYYIDGSNIRTFAWKAWTSDGITIACTKTGSPTGTVNFQILFMR